MSTILTDEEHSPAKSKRGSRKAPAGKPKAAAASNIETEPPAARPSPAQPPIAAAKVNPKPPAPGPVAAPSSSGFSLAGEVDLLVDFTVESREYIANIESSLLILERDPGDMEAIHSAFRGFHTIKGLAGFLELDRIQLLTHEVETLLDAVRNGRLRVNSA